MSLSCSCNSDDAEWYYVAGDDFSTLNTKRGRRCCSCKKKLSPGDEVLAFRRTREPRNDIEMSIYGDDWEAVPMAPWFMCETCGGLYMAVEDLGMCCSLTEPIADQIKEYQP